MPPDAKRTVVFVSVKRIAEAEPRLERAGVGLPVGAVGEVAVGVDVDEELAPKLGQRIDQGAGSHEILVVHPRLIVPPDPRVDGEPICRTPVVLRVDSQMIVFPSISGSPKPSWAWTGKAKLLSELKLKTGFSLSCLFSLYFTTSKFAPILITCDPPA